MVEDHPAAQVVQEEYLPFDYSDFESVTNDMKNKNADVVVSGVEGGSNINMMKQMDSAGLTADELPVMGLDTDEIYIRSAGPDIMKGHFASSPYFMSLKNERNKEFVQKFQAEYGDDEVVGMFNQSSYYTTKIWKNAIEKAGSLDPNKIREASAGVSLQTPEGPIRLFDNYYISTTPRAGRITGSDKGEDMIETLWSTQQPILPDPYLKAFPWGDEISAE